MKKRIFIIGALIIATLFMFVTGCEKNPDLMATDAPPLSGVSFELVSIQDEYLTMKWTNDSDRIINFGRSAQLLTEKNGEWEQIGSLSQDKGIMNLEPGQSMEFNYYFYECEVTEGNKYKVTVMFSHLRDDAPDTSQIAAEFEV